MSKADGHAWNVEVGISKFPTPTILMNIHAPKTSKTKFHDWEFRGKPFLSKNRRWLRAKSKTFNKTWYYCFETDSIYDGIYDEREMPIV